MADDGEGESVVCKGARLRIDKSDDRDDWIASIELLLDVLLVLLMLFLGIFIDNCDDDDDDVVAESLSSVAFEDRC